MIHRWREGALSFAVIILVLLAFVALIVILFSGPPIKAAIRASESPVEKASPPIYDFSLEDIDPVELARDDWRIRWRRIICVFSKC